MKKFIMLFAAMMISFAAFAQENPMMRPVPMDSAVRYGKLPNGLTYYIRHNERPKERCEFHIAQAVGAILEEDHQNGLAHFLEHMCFNGTEHFPGKGIINYFESVGVSFGGDINAYTSLDETVYRLSNVPTTREGILDSALLVLYDWSCAVSLLGEEIDNERGVIREEWRTGNNASRRMWRNAMRLTMPGSQYAKRDVIGDTAVINNFSYQAIRDYYEKWYGPDLQAIVVVGDIDVDKMEQKIVKLFSPIEPRVGLTPRTRYGAIDNKEPIVGVYLDHEAQSQEISFGFKHPHQPAEVTLSLAGYASDLMLDLLAQCMNTRFNELTQNPDCNFTGMYGYYSNYAGETDAFEFGVSPKNGKELAAFRDLCSEFEKLRRYGITESELEIVKANYLSSLESSFNERNNRQSQSLARGCYRHYLDNNGRSLTSPYFDLQTCKLLLSQINAQVLNQIFNQLIPEDNSNMYIIALGKDKKDENGMGCDECQMPTEQVLLQTYLDAKNLTIEAPKDNKIDRPLVAKEPKAGKVVKTEKNTALDVTELTLSNGVKVIIKTTDFKSDEINMEAYSKGGYSRYPTSDVLNAQLATSVVAFNGIGTFTPTDLQKVLAGKEVSVNPSIDRFSESMSGYSTIKDFETMLKLNYLYFTAPRTDDKLFKSLINLVMSSLASRSANPKTEFSDHISKALYANSERNIIIDTNTIKLLNQKRAIAIYKERFANPADFTFYFVGNIDANDTATIALLEKWLGGLKTTKKFEDYVDDKMYYAHGGNYDYFKRPMATKTASNRVVITGYDFEYTLANRLKANLIGNILSTRYLESIREREGGSYGVGTYCQMQKRPVPCMLLLANFDTDPDKQNRLLNIVYEEMETIIKDGPLATDLNKEKENLVKEYNQDLRENDYWLNTILPQYYNNNVNYLTDYLPTVNAIDGAAIQQTLKALYEQNNRVEVVMMPTR